MYRSTPAHKQTDPAKAPGQIVNPVPHGARWGWPVPFGPEDPGVSSHTGASFYDTYGVSADEKQAVASIGTANALVSDGEELEGSACD